MNLIKAVQVFLIECGYTHILSMNKLIVVFVLFNIKLNGTVSLNLIIIVHTKTTKQYGITSMPVFCYPLQKSLLTP